jgi:hypothetical protein
LDNCHSLDRHPKKYNNNNKNQFSWFTKLKSPNAVKKLFFVNKRGCEYSKHKIPYPLSLPQNKLDALFVSWCLRGLNPLIPAPVSPQCSCKNNFHVTFMNNSAAFILGDGPKDLAMPGGATGRWGTEGLP